MGWDNAGGYTRQYNFSADASAGINILAARMDAEMDDFASAMTIAWARNGQNVPTQDIPMGGRKFVNVGAPTSVNNFMRAREFIENVPIFMQDAESSADRISVSSQYFTSVSANQAPADGTKIMVRVKSNKSSAVMYVDGHSANVEYQDGTRIAAALVSGGIYEFTYSSVDTAWKVPTPSGGRTTAEISAGVTPTNYRFPEGHAWRYGADPAGASDSRAALQATVDVAAAGGDSPFWPTGTYLINSTPSSDSLANGVVVPYSGTANSTDQNFTIKTGGRSTILKAGSNSMIVLRWSASNCGLGSLTIDSNSKTGCWGLGVVPEDMTQTSTVVNQLYNSFDHLWLSGALDAGIVLKCGPRVTGTDSGCWYNSFTGVHVFGPTRGIWFREGTNAGSSPPNRNYFERVRIGQGCNVGVYLESGATNKFVGLDLEGIDTGTSPLATPTGIYVAATDANGQSNLANTFACVTFESCTQDITNLAASTNYVACFATQAKCTWTAFPAVFIGGYLATSGPAQAFTGYHYQSNGEVSAYPDDVAVLTNGAMLLEKFHTVGRVSPAQLSGNVDDYAPSGFSGAINLRLSSDASRNITGLAGGLNGREIRIYNVGAQDIVLTNEDAASTAANRFLLGANVTLGANESIHLWYDDVSTRWRAVGRHN